MSNSFNTYVCIVCGFIYDEAAGRPEDKIAAARRYYNTTVRVYITKQQTLPTSLIAGALGHHPVEFYRLEDDAQREPIQVELGA